MQRAHFKAAIQSRPLSESLIKSTACLYRTPLIFAARGTFFRRAYGHSHCNQQATKQQNDNPPQFSSLEDLKSHTIRFSAPRLEDTRTDKELRTEKRRRLLGKIFAISGLLFTCLLAYNMLTEEVTDWVGELQSELQQEKLKMLDENKAK